MSYELQAVGALQLLKRKGVALLMKRTSGQTHDPVAQTTTGTATVEQSIQAAILPASESRDLSFEERALVRRNRRKLYVAGKAPDGTALAFEPDLGNTVEFEGSTWKMGPSSRLAPDGGAPVLFTLEVTR